ncbi:MULTISPECIES: hypothetical protein [unclassified Streptomyces]|uniref:hypothetical protein n=1 Tax=unclassified Streptomyces TaxID=2593676 RepID=UPI002E2BF04D|nr:hypothetical protein [Streptomyces sp. NBC_01423]WSX91928.1 hypothetical protein OH827_15910 [Streptomyces sp. NBC_00891]WSY06405.1 hypothetical protein OG464_15910 [Streptomyces sp. NBC_00890]WSZ08029.1 hypothetical protein OG704_15910 [Streptomyces sp. NBC_00869]WSZ24471.1 hypothetical protein OG498_17655 [Streptomyces sp. NBC_00870]
MREFLDATLSFPAVLFAAALVVVIAFWLLVLVGAADHHSFDTDLDTDLAGVGGVPVTVSVSLMVAVGWFTSLTGSVLVHRSGTTGAVRATLACAVLAGALLLAWGAVRLLVHHFRRYFPDQPPPSRQDFLGRVCTIRTGSVGTDFGQAEVTAADGSTAIVQVRQLEPADAELTSGSSGLLYAYDEAGEFFWVSPYDQALDPGPPPAALPPHGRTA